MDSIKHRIAIWQMATGKSKDDLCEMLGMSRSALYAKLNGISDFTLTEARILAKQFGCSIDDLLIDPIGEYMATVN